MIVSLTGNPDVLGLKMSQVSSPPKHGSMCHEHLGRKLRAKQYSPCTSGKGASPNLNKRELLKDPILEVFRGKKEGRSGLCI